MTLVELLVVIAIFTILAAMLLPAMGRTMRTARTVACLATLKQVHAGFFAYAGDYGGWPPECEHNPIYGCRYAAEYSADGYLNAWGVLCRAGYLPVKMLFCPARKKARFGYRPAPAMYGWTHYNYAHNYAWRNPTATPYGTPPKLKRIFSDPTLARKIILTDDPSGGITPPVSLTDPAAIATQQIRPDYWGHVDGGNVVRHEGSARFVENFWDYHFPTSPDGWPNSGRGWPSWYYWDGWAQVEKRLE